MNIRRARPAEAGTITALVRRSKAYWGYDDDFMAAVQPDLTVTPDLIRDRHTHVCETSDGLVGCYDIAVGKDAAELELFFVDPDHIGRGVGRQLWRHLVDHARRCGARRLRIESDPSAASFYQAMGAQLQGEVQSHHIPGRALPLLTYDLEQQVAGAHLSP